MSKLKLWSEDSDWEKCEALWEEGAKKAKSSSPIKSLTRLPKMPGMTEETKKFLKWKSFKWLVMKDHGFKIFRHFLKHPIKYSQGLIRSWLKKKSYQREGDFFYYGVKNTEEFEKLLKDPDSLLVLGFSYCHKPFECPSGRFSDQCIHDPDNPVCRQCFIGKATNASPDKGCIPLFIPTVHYIGEKIFEIVHSYPTKKVIFIITACEMTLEMFGDWGNMVGIQGIGIRLDGRICNTLEAFRLSEEGIKPGLTVVLDDTAKEMLRLIKERREVKVN